MIADVLWVFPSIPYDRLEVMPVTELLDWHAKAVARKQTELQAANTGADRIAATLARLLPGR